eukprot:8105840-Ditylum_brightwellii.AAC.1
MMKHGIYMDLIPQCFGGEGTIEVEDEHFPFYWNDENLFWKTSKSKKDNLDNLEAFELNLP